LPHLPSAHPLRRASSSLHLAVAAPLLLAGLFPLHQEASGRWGLSGSWVYPVGDAHSLSAEAPKGDAQYRAMRGVSEGVGSESRHQGVDLSNGRGGGPVRAAGNGLVVAVGAKGWNRGYGRHVVIAHRFLDGGMVYTMYAHLAPGSIKVRAGQFVEAGRVIGRVGMTGRATSPHLHFEVRVPVDPGVRWEKAPVVDPLSFVAARRPARQDSTWASPYIEWAECAALIPSGETGAEPLRRSEWWRALAAASPDATAPLPSTADSLRDALIRADVLSSDSSRDAQALVGWTELARDLRRARRQGLRLPWSPVVPALRRKDCRRELGVDSPSGDPDALAKVVGQPSRAAACLALADLAGDPPSSRKAQPHPSLTASRDR
jgi:hypothetical protein